MNHVSKKEDSMMKRVESTFGKLVNSNKDKRSSAPAQLHAANTNYNTPNNNSKSISSEIKTTEKQVENKVPQHKKYIDPDMKKKRKSMVNVTNAEAKEMD